jgi:methylmalonyl-CoA mutase N-terminal domain/subunit
LEQEAETYINKIDELGGIVRAIEVGFPQKELSDAAYHYQNQVEKDEKTIVGVNKYVMDQEIPIPILKIDESVERKQTEATKALRQSRDNQKVALELKKIEQAAKDGSNLMECFVSAVREYCTLGEIIDVLRGVFGEHQDPGML